MYAYHCLATCYHIFIHQHEIQSCTHIIALLHVIIYSYTNSALAAIPLCFEAPPRHKQGTNRPAHYIEEIGYKEGFIKHKGATKATKQSNLI